MIRIFFLSQSSPILELFPFDKITLKSYICTVVTIMAKQCWSRTVLESGSWGHSVLQTPALVFFFLHFGLQQYLTNAVVLGLHTYAHKHTHARACACTHIHSSKYSSMGWGQIAQKCAVHVKSFFFSDFHTPIS